MGSNLAYVNRRVPIKDIYNVTLALERDIDFQCQTAVNFMLCILQETYYMGTGSNMILSKDILIL